MALELLLLAAAVSASPLSDKVDAPGYARVRAQGQVAVRIVGGARIAAGEIQHSDVPKVQDSQVRSPDGNSSPARLVEFP